jgi:hypothetical protein
LLIPLEVIVKTPLSITDVPALLSDAHSFQLRELESKVSLILWAFTTEYADNTIANIIIICFINK